MLATASPVESYYVQHPAAIQKAIRHQISRGAADCYWWLQWFERQNGTCNPDQRWLAEDLAVSVRQVRRYLVELERAGFLTIERPAGGARNIYTLQVVPKPASGRRTCRTQMSASTYRKKVSPIGDRSKGGTASPSIAPHTERLSSDESIDQTRGHWWEAPHWIRRITADFTAELGGNPAYVGSNITQAHRLFQQSGLDPDAFVDRMRAARREARRHKPRFELVMEVDGPDGQPVTIRKPNRIRLFFLILRQLGEERRQ